MESYSTQEPKQVELIAPEVYRVRWDIQKITKEVEGEETEGTESVDEYVYQECTVYAPLTQNSILESAIRESVSSSQELKLINDYNAFQIKVITDNSVEEKYKTFIEWRNSLKAKIDEVCLYNNIQ